VGGGFTWSAAVLDILDVPEWTAPFSAGTQVDL
jgi:hypothetical protein